MRRLLFPLLLPGLFGVGSGQAQVPDPTRPAGHASESGVQTVILRPGGKSGAVINGEYLEIGGRIGDRRVTNISENEVTLTSERGTEVLNVMSAIRKRPRSRPAGEKKAAEVAPESPNAKGHAAR